MSCSIIIPIASASFCRELVLGFASLLSRRANAGCLIPAVDVVEVPPSMADEGDCFVLQVKGISMEEDGMLDGDFVVVRTAARYTPIWEPSRPGHLYLDLTGAERPWGPVTGKARAAFWEENISFGVA